jgi:exosome complex RNA-binding protein Rrp42 (RNase PH superfamily)
VWKVSVECSVCTDDGNILDCLLNGVVLALMDVRKPLIKLTGDKVRHPICRLKQMRRSSKVSASHTFPFH